MSLTKQDLDLLIDAVEVWEKERTADMAFGNVMGAVFCKTPLERQLFEHEMKKAKADAKAETGIRKERSVLLRAKLIGLRDSLHAGQVFGNAIKEGATGVIS